MKQILISFILLLFCNTVFAEDVVLYEYTTKFVYKGEKENRAKNIELAANKINNTVLQPEEIFSYNSIVGNRTYKNGFKDAPVIINNELVDGIGGGVCQVSSTLNAVVLHTGLEIIESFQHSRTSSYIDPGLDSTVSWGAKDFKFKNNLPFPITIKTNISYEKNIALLSIKIYGKEKYFNVKMENIIVHKGKLRFKKILRDDLPIGYRKILEFGSRELAIIRKRTISFTKNNSLFREESIDILYNYSPRIIEIGTKNDQ